MKTTVFKEGRLIYTCPNCGHSRDESADPAKNPDPFKFLGGGCTGCSAPINADWDVIEEAHATFHQKR